MSLGPLKGTNLKDKKSEDNISRVFNANCNIQFYCLLFKEIEGQDFLKD